MSELFEESIKIYNKLADFESKEIFANRIQYSITKDYQYIRDLVSAAGKGFEDGAFDKKQAENILRNLKACLQGKKVIIYGAGYVGREIKTLLHEVNICGFCDQNSEKLEKQVDGMDVYSVEAAAQIEDVTFIIGSWRYRESMWEALRSQGVKEKRIIDFPSNCMINVSSEQYFEKDLISFGENEVFVDCGSYHFETSLEFIKQAKGRYKYIFAYEPDPANYEMIQGRIVDDKIQNAKCICAGVWKESGKLSFQSDMDSSMIVENGTKKIDVISLDKELEGEPVSFIKMDIEGAELEALYGAKNIILKNRPKLAISIYHKPEDMIALPKYILDLKLDYKLYLRHYSNSDVETVLYAI